MITFSDQETPEASQGKGATEILVDTNWVAESKTTRSQKTNRLALKEIPPIPWMGRPLGQRKGEIARHERHEELT
jgi:hypothetical protein